MAVMEQFRSDRLHRVIAAMGLIRPLFDAQHCSVAAFADRVIAQVMLELCPDLTDWWLSPEHLRQAFERLQAKKNQ